MPTNTVASGKKGNNMTGILDGIEFNVYYMNLIILMGFNYASYDYASYDYASCHHASYDYASCRHF